MEVVYKILIGAPLSQISNWRDWKQNLIESPRLSTKLTFCLVNSVGGNTSIGPIKVTDAVFFRGGNIIVSSEMSHQNANIHRVSQAIVKFLDGLLKCKNPGINFFLVAPQSFPSVSIISVNVTLAQCYVRGTVRYFSQNVK